MNRYPPGRRDFLKGITALGTACLPYAARVGAAGPSTKPAYDPAATFELAVSEVELRRNSAGRMLMARIYQPKGAGPFPTVLDLHGGAWNAKDRRAEEPMDRAIAASGVLVVAIDLTLAHGSTVSSLRAGCELRGAVAEDVTPRHGTAMSR